MEVSPAMEDEDLLTSLGASAVVASDFEQKFLNHLEEKLKEAEAEEQKGGDETLLEDGEIEEDENSFSKEKVGGDEQNEEKVDIGTAEAEKQDGGFKMEPSNFLLRALTAPSAKKVPVPAPVPIVPAKKKPIPVKKVAKEKPETEQQRKIRNGEMTPFGTEILASTSSASTESNK